MNENKPATIYEEELPDGGEKVTWVQDGHPLPKPAKVTRVITEDCKDAGGTLTTEYDEAGNVVRRIRHLANPRSLHVKEQGE